MNGKPRFPPAENEILRRGGFALLINSGKISSFFYSVFITQGFDLRSDSKLFSAFGSSAFQDFSAVGVGHSGAEAMDLFMLTVFGLECSFHDNISSSIQIKNIYFIFPQVKRYCGSIYYCIVCLLYQNTRSIVNNESALFA